MTANHKGFARSIRGVEGRMYPRHLYADGLYSAQVWKASRPAARGETLTVEMRFDDTHRNGHQTFAITATLRKDAVRGDAGFIPGGCLHDDIARVFPELAPLIRWHLTSTDGPMHYVANAVYLAGDRDCNGLRAGERRQIRNGKSGLPAWRMVAVGIDGEELPTHSLPRYVDAAEKPECAFRLEWRAWERVGEGKARELDAARRTAVWPDATDEELSAEPDVLRAALLARLPALMAAFRAEMDACGFEWRVRAEAQP